MASPQASPDPLDLGSWDDIETSSSDLLVPIPSSGASKAPDVVPRSAVSEAHQELLAAPLPRLFFAHGKGDEPYWVANAAKHALLSYRDLFGPAELVIARDDFKARIKNCDSSWESWGRSVTETAFVAGDFRLRYDAIIVPDRTTGRGTATVVRYALGRGVPVMLWSEGVTRRDLTFRRVVQLVAKNEDDWKQGWTLRVEGGT